MQQVSKWYKEKTQATFPGFLETLSPEWIFKIFSLVSFAVSHGQGPPGSAESQPGAGA